MEKLIWNNEAAEMKGGYITYQILPYRRVNTHCLIIRIKPFQIITKVVLAGDMHQLQPYAAEDNCEENLNIILTFII